MKKILLAFTLLIFGTLAYPKDIQTFDINETYFINNVKSYNQKTYGDFKFKGLWADPKNLSRSIMYEDIFCNLSTNMCSSSLATINFWGTINANLPPLLTVYSLYYEIIDKKDSKYKLYSPETEYTIDVDLTRKTAKKYKVFNNGDINNYALILNKDSVSKYIQTIIED